MQTKQRFFRFLKKAAGDKTNKWELYLWFLFHLGVPALLLISIFTTGNISVNTSLFDMLPGAVNEKSVMEADAVLGEKNGREMVILSASGDFNDAKKGALLLYESFKDSPDFSDILFYFDSSVMENFYRYLFDYRFMICAGDTLALLENGQAQEIAYDALASVYGAINFFPLDRIEKDPFLLTERRMGEFLSSSLLSGAMTLKEDIIAASKDGVFYVMLKMTLAPGKVSLQADKNAVGKIYSQTAEIKEEIKDLNFYYSGIPFHIYESSSGAQREISVISTITLLLILIIFLYIFKTAAPVFYSILAIIVSIGMAASAALLVFREIHIITFVFGTTLIGTCVDYSVHFFVHWKKNALMQSGAQIRYHIIKNISMSFISTQICFIVFFLSPFPILKQFAVFSIAGLISSFLTFFCVYPRLGLPKNRNNTKISTTNHTNNTNPHHQIFSSLVMVRDGSWLKKVNLFIITGLVITMAVLFIINSSNIKIKNDLSSLYTMSDTLLESEIKTAQVLEHGSPGWYFIVSGSTAEQTLENEEILGYRLQEEINKGNMDSYLAASVFVPSIKSQTRTYNAMKELIPLSVSQYEYLGFPDDYAQIFKMEFDNSKFCLPENAPRQAGVSNLWIGEINDTFYSCVMPMSPKAEESLFREIANEYEFVHFINKVKDIGDSLDTLTKTMLFLFLGAYLIVSVFIFLAFKRKESVKICLVPLLLVLASVLILAMNKISIGFFSAAALVLVFGLSLDYIFFMSEKKQKEEKKITLIGVTLSYLTTLLSFGALAFSSFMPVHLFGLTVCAGLTAAFISAVILQSRETEDNKRISG